MTTVHRTRTDAEFDIWFRAQPACVRNSAGLADEMAREALVNSASTKFHTGHYAASWRVIRLPNGEARLVNQDRNSYLLEVGTGIFGPRHRPIEAKLRLLKTPAHKRTIKVKGGGTRRVNVKASSRMGRAMVFRPYNKINAFPDAPTQSFGDVVFAQEVKGQPGSFAGHRAVASVTRSRPGVRFLPVRDLIV